MSDEIASGWKHRGYNPEFVKKALARRSVSLPAAGQPVRVSGVPLWVSDLVNLVARNHQIDVGRIMGKDRSQDAVIARNEVLYEVRRKNPVLSFPKIGFWFNRDHTAVMFAIATHARRNFLPKLTEFDLDSHAAARKRFVDKRKRQRWAARRRGPEPDLSPKTGSENQSGVH